MEHQVFLTSIFKQVYLLTQKGVSLYKALLMAEQQPEQQEHLLHHIKA